MKRIVKKETATGIVQITICDERWYELEGIFVPSVTWIADHYPKGTAFYKWLANHGWDEAESLKQAAGDKGSKVHNAIVDLIDGKTVKMTDSYYNETLDAQEELSLEEYEALMSFADWWKEAKPTVLAQDYIVWNQEKGYAGTVDLLCGIDGENWLIDFKTSQYIWPSHELQISAYKHADTNEIDKLAILQLGFRRNKRKWKLTEIEDKFDLFLAAKKVWQNENAGIEPKKRDYPVEIKL